MRLPGKVTHALLLAIAFVGLAFRYPMSVSHELGSDTTFIHSLADSILSSGSAVWANNPSAYFGLYGLSYPSGMPFLFAEFSMSSGIQIEGTLLLAGFAFSMAGTVGAYIAARALRDDDRLALAAALIFTTAPFFVKDTSWVGSARGYVTALVPILFWLFLRHMQTRDPRILVMMLGVVLLMGVIHRMGFLAIILLVAYAFSLPFHRVTQQLRFLLTRYESAFRISSTAIAVGGFLGLFYIQFLFPGLAGADVVQQYGNGAFLHGTSFPILVANMLLSLVGKIGILMPLAVIGMIKLAWSRPKGDRDKFLLIAVLVMIPLISLRDYIAEFLTYLFAILVVLPIFVPTRLPLRRTSRQASRRRTVALIVIGVLLLTSIVSSWVLKSYWQDTYVTDGPIPDSLYSAALYMTWQTHGTTLSNQGLSAGRLTAISGLPVLPIGGASEHWFGPQQLTFGFVNQSEVQVRPVALTSISFYTDTIFAPFGVPNAKDDYEAMFYGNLANPTTQHLFQEYRVQYLFVDSTHKTEFQSYIWRPSPMTVQAEAQTYTVYASGDYSLWYLG